MTSFTTQKHIITSTSADALNDKKQNLSLPDSVCADYVDIDIDAIKQLLCPAVKVINLSTPITNGI